MLDTITSQGAALLGPAWPVVWTLVKIVALVLPLMICVAYLTLWERVGIGYTQIRLGPNRVGPRGWLQPIADAVKLIFKEVILPTAANLAVSNQATFAYDADLNGTNETTGLSDDPRVAGSANATVFLAEALPMVPTVNDSMLLLIALALGLFGVGTVVRQRRG